MPLSECSIHSMIFCLDVRSSNMLTISFGTRTETATDPLVEKALAMAMEFMDLTGAIFCGVQSALR